MSTIAVIYATKTGHSEALARAIAEAAGAKIQNAQDASLTDKADLLFIVGGIYGGKSHPDLIRFAEGLSGKAVKKAVLVTSSVSVSKRSQSDIRRILLDSGIEILDEITCAGSLLFLKSGHPNADDMTRIAERALEIKTQCEYEGGKAS